MGLGGGWKGDGVGGRTGMGYERLNTVRGYKKNLAYKTHHIVVRAH